MNSKKLKVLVVEDDPIAEKVILSILQQHYHCNIEVAKTATEALTQVNDRAFEWDRNGYDIIFMDIFLPDINGDVLTEVIRKTEVQAQSTPIIAVSGKVLPEDKQCLLDMGVTDLILKPVTVEKIDSVLRQHFDLTEFVIDNLD